MRREMRLVLTWLSDVTLVLNQKGKVRQVNQSHGIISHWCRTDVVSLFIKSLLPPPRPCTDAKAARSWSAALGKAKVYHKKFKFTNVAHVVPGILAWRLALVF